jgi:hypothetical protein
MFCEAEVSVATPIDKIDIAIASMPAFSVVSVLFLIVIISTS